VYIGIGKAWRAWATGSTRLSNPASKGYGRRDLWHAGWLEEQYAKGFLPSDWVKIIHRQLDKKFAMDIEKQLIETHLPKFNKNHNKNHRDRKRFPIELITEVKKLRAQGMSYERIAEAKELSSGMAAWRMVNE
jgi:hypothetical protein